MVGLLSPVLLAARACAQVLGVAGGLIYARRSRSSRRPTPSRLLIEEPEAAFNGFRRLAKMVRIDSGPALPAGIHESVRDRTGVPHTRDCDYRLTRIAALH